MSRPCLSYRRVLTSRHSSRFHPSLRRRCLMSRPCSMSRLSLRRRCLMSRPCSMSRLSLPHRHCLRFHPAQKFRRLPLHRHYPSFHPAQKFRLSLPHRHCLRFHPAQKFRRLPLHRHYPSFRPLQTSHRCQRFRPLQMSRQYPMARRCSRERWRKKWPQQQRGLCTMQSSVPMCSNFSTASLAYLPTTRASSSSLAQHRAKSNANDGQANRVVQSRPRVCRSESNTFTGHRLPQSAQ